MADLFDAISDAREVVKTISSVDDRISLITSQIDTAPKQTDYRVWLEFGLITSQIDTAPKPPVDVVDYEADLSAS